MSTVELSGKVAIVTGSGVPGGIGDASARALAEAGAQVVLADLAGSALRDVADALTTDGYAVVAQDVDVSDEASIEALVRFTLETFGRLDIVDNNAAATDLVPEDQDIRSISLDVWDRMMTVNVRGPMLLCRHSLTPMLAQGGGSIINISSGKSLGGDFDQPAYSASKAALNSLTRTVAVTYGKQGIRCNAIAPGLMQTALMKRVVPEARAKAWLDCILLDRLGEPADIANLVVFLSSDRGSYITGQVISVDGGVSAELPFVPLRRQSTDEVALRHD